MPYEFTDFYTPVIDQRGNNYPELLPSNIMTGHGKRHD